MLNGLVPFFKKGSIAVTLKKCTKTWYWVEEKKLRPLKKCKTPFTSNVRENTPNRGGLECLSSRGVESFRNSDASKKLKSKQSHNSSKPSVNYSQNNIENLCPEDDEIEPKNNKPIPQKINCNSTLFYTSKYNLKI